MTNLIPVSSFDNVPQLETTTPAKGGPGGPINLPAQALLNRTQYLNDLVAPLPARITSLEVSQGASMIGYATKAAMDADLAHGDGSLALVTNDAATSNNATYRKSGASGAGSWVLSVDRVTAVSADLNSRVAKGFSRSGFWGGIMTPLGRLGMAFRKSDGRAIFGVGGDVVGRVEMLEAGAAATVSVVAAPRNGVLWGIKTPAGRLLAHFDKYTGAFKVAGRDILAAIDALSARVTANEAAIGNPLKDFPSANWACWGDSLTGAGSSGDWPSKLATLLGVTVYNGGVGGQAYKQIAARQGGTPALMTVTGGTIPASGAIDVTSNGYYPASNGQSVAGTLSGVPGIYARAADGLSATFTRTTAGAAVASPANAAFTPTDGASNRDCHVVLWTGRNSFLFSPQVEVIQSIRAMIAYLTPRVARVIVMEVPPTSAETLPAAAGSNREKLEAFNALLKASFPAHFLDVASYLRTAAAATAAGISFTTQDNTDITNGVTPTSFTTDGLHFSQAGGTAIAARVKQEAQTRGWIA